MRATIVPVAGHIRSADEITETVRMGKMTGGLGANWDIGSLVSAAGEW
jgi:hypothetical protein